MKNFLLLAIAAATIQAQAAGSINFDMRADMLSQDYNDAALATGAPGVDNYSFRIQTGRIDYKGSLNEKKQVSVLVFVLLQKIKVPWKNVTIQTLLWTMLVELINFPICFS